MNVPSGLYYISDIVSNDLEKDILNWLETSEIKSLQFPVGKGKSSRNVIHFGYKYNYTQKTSGEITHPIPQILLKLLSLVNNFYDVSQFNQAILNQYYPGQGINAHTDIESYGDIIVVFSLGSGIEMEFTRDGYQSYKVYVESRSVYIMTGESRYEWKHQIRPRLTDTVGTTKIKRETRWSITYRIVPK